MSTRSIKLVPRGTHVFDEDTRRSVELARKAIDEARYAIDEIFQMAELCIDAEEFGLLEIHMHYANACQRLHLVNCELGNIKMLAEQS